MLLKIDRVLLNIASSLVHSCGRGFGWNRHDVVSALLIAELACLLVSGTAVIAVVLDGSNDPTFRAIWIGTIGFVCLLEKRVFDLQFARSRRNSADLESISGWKRDLDLTRIQSEVHDETGPLILALHLVMTPLFLVLSIMTAFNAAMPVPLIPVLMMTRQALELLQRYVLLVPPSPPSHKATNDVGTGRLPAPVAG